MFQEFIDRAAIDLDDRPHDVTPIAVSPALTRTVEFNCDPAQCDAMMLIMLSPSLNSQRGLCANTAH